MRISNRFLDISLDFRNLVWEIRFSTSNVFILTCLSPPHTHTHITHHALHTCNASNSSLTVKSSGKKFVYSLIRSALTFALLAAYGQGHAITIEETVTASPQRPFSGDVTIQPNIGSGISSENNHIEFTVVPSEQESGNLLVTASIDPAVSVSKDGIVGNSVKKYIYQTIENEMYASSVTHNRYKDGLQDPIIVEYIGDLNI